MQIIKHRVNSIKELRELNPEWGAEIDLRSDCHDKGRILLSHDPWIGGDSLQEWLLEYRRLESTGPIILNTKEDGLETVALDTLRRLEIDSFFFLDTTVPTLVKWTGSEGRTEFAVRVSRYEPPENARAFQGTASWVWVDCFNGVPLAKAAILPLKKHFQVCLVSPELQGRPIEWISQFDDLGTIADAVCTKSPDAWITRIGKQ